MRFLDAFVASLDLRALGFSKAHCADTGRHPFGTIKRWFGYTHFLLKGLAKVQCEWTLTTLAYNLKRVLNLVSFDKLMAEVA